MPQRGPTETSSSRLRAFPRCKRRPLRNLYGPGAISGPPKLCLSPPRADCFVLTFRAIARASNLSWATLRCDAKGRLERTDGITRFTQLTLNAHLAVPPATDSEKARRLLEKAEKACLITNSLALTPVLTCDVETVHDEELGGAYCLSVEHDGQPKVRGRNMEIRRWMKHPVHSVKPLDSIQHARDLMERHRVNQLPVVVDGRLVGIITDRDLRDAFPSVFDTAEFARRKPKVAMTNPKAVTVEMVMTANVTTAGPGDSMADAMRLMRRQRIGALPVVEGKGVVGILTRSDILDGCIDLVELEDRRESSLFTEETA